MKQSWFFLIAIALIGLLSLSFYLYRYSSFTLNGRALEMEGNFTHSLTIQQVESMLGSFNLTNTSSTFSSQNVTTTKQEIPLVQNLDRNYDLVIDFDRNLVDTLSRIIISALRQSNLSSQKLLDSSQTSDLNELGQYSIDGKWNASIVARNMANFSGLIEARNIIDGQLQYFKVSLVADTKEIEYLEREGNVTIVIKGNATVNIDNQQIEVPTILVIREMKQIYMLMLGDSDLLPNKFFLYGKVSRISA
ncbi:MAG TPA: hypothetical protein VH415_06970 [Nitrososphaeraceae archaeon]